MRTSRLVAHLIFFFLFAFSAAAGTYRCLDPAGKRVYTDSPSQLDQCTLLREPEAAPPTSASVRTPAFPPGSAASPEPVEPAAGPPALGEPATDLLHVTVPVQRAGRSLTVQVRVNGTHDARLIVDTGADITILSHKLALDLGIAPSSTSKTVTLNTVGGSVRADVVKLATLAVGAAEVRDVPVAVHTLPEAPDEVDGLLGLTFLDKFLVTLDARNGELHLRKRD